MNEEKFTFFYRGPFGQWYLAPMVIDGIEYSCAEKYMMAEKARLFNDEEILAKIMAEDKPKEQKSLGRQVRNLNKEKWNDEDKAKWNSVAKDAVYKGNIAKFTQHEDLKKILLATDGTTLVEASPVDFIWGIGLDENDPDRFFRSKWKGSNWLGEVLTKVRENIKKGIK